MNLLYIFADQWRRDALGIYDKRVITPNMDKFAGESVVFDRAYSSCPLCSPHRGCLLTGKHPVNTNVFTNCKPDVNACLREDDVCVSDILKSNGYTTGYIGKWHLDRPDGNGGWDAYTPPGKKRHGFDFWYSYGADNSHLTPHYWDTDGNIHQINQWSPEHETDIALDFIKRNKENDFALFMSINPPHAPYHLTPEKYKTLYRGIKSSSKATAAAPSNVGDRAEFDDFDRDVLEGYYGAVTGIDENIGRILSCLKENRLYDNTYIIISADHGDMLGEHRLVAKHIWYEGSVGIPLIIGGGGISHKRTDVLINSPDQTATILGLLGIEVPEFMEGKDFSPLIRGEKMSGHSSVMSAAFPNTGERILEFERHGKSFMDYGWRSVVTERYKLAVCKGMSYGAKKQVYLYDLQNDPYENCNISNQNVMNAMMDELRKWCDITGDGFLDNE